MYFVTSRNYVLPDSPEGFSSGLWFNLWMKKLWPYNELEVGDTLYWYESPSKCIVWKSRVLDVLRFSYRNKKEVGQKLSLTPIQSAQSYFIDGPESGYCLSYRVEAIERLSLPRPDDFKFPHQGWLEVHEDTTWAWPGLSFDETKPRSELVKQIGDAVAKATIPLDQAIMKLKEIYDAMPNEERSILKSWVGQLAPLQRNPSCPLLIGRANVNLRYPNGPDEDIVVNDLAPIMVLNAIESWEVGDAYNPGTFSELGWA